MAGTREKATFCSWHCAGRGKGRQQALSACTFSTGERQSLGKRHQKMQQASSCRWILGTWCSLGAMIRTINNKSRDARLAAASGAGSLTQVLPAAPQWVDAVWGALRASRGLRHWHPVVSPPTPAPTRAGAAASAHILLGWGWAGAGAPQVWRDGAGMRLRGRRGMCVSAAGHG